MHCRQNTDKAVLQIPELTEGKAFYVSDEGYLTMLHQVLIDITTRGCLTEAVASVSMVRKSLRI